MPVDAQLTADDEARLAAMWEPPLDSEPVGGQPDDDAIAELFSSSSGRQARNATREGKRDRRLRAAGRRARHRSLHRPVWPRATYRWVAVGLTLVTPLVVITVARDASTGPAETKNVESTRDPSRHSTARTPRGSRELGAAHRRHTHDARARRDRNRRRARARRAPQPKGTARRARARTTRARRRARVSSRPTAPPPAPTPTPQAPQPRRTQNPSAPSSACDEFPPC